MVPNSCKHVHAYQDNLPKMKLPKFGGRGAAPRPPGPYGYEGTLILHSNKDQVVFIIIQML